MTKTILILAANPSGTKRLSLDQEVRDIDDVLRRAGKRDQFDLEQRWAVRPRDVQAAMLDCNPAIVHFCGHGTGEDGLVLEDVAGRPKLVSAEALAGLFELFVEQVECVILNACYSEVQATAIGAHIPHVIGMNQPIGDQAAIEFSVGFYQAIGAGRPYPNAFKFGRSAIQMAGLTGHATLVLVSDGGVSPPASSQESPITPLGSSTQAVAKPVDVTQGIGGERLYRALLGLGYHKQAKFFMQLKRAHDVAALLIYGLPEHGQRWLLNRLVVQFLPELMNGKVATVDLRDVSQRHSVDALWRQFGRQFGLGGRAERQAIIEQTHHCLESQDILLVFHGVDSTTESAMQELIAEFWLPLIGKLSGVEQFPESHKLLMFLLDYKGVTEDWTLPFVEKIDLKRQPRLENPARSPRLEQFSPDELEDWLVGAYGDLPDEVGDRISDKIEEIIARSDEGIPELVLDELCDYCGINWYEMRSRWLRL